MYIGDKARNELERAERDVLAYQEALAALAEKAAHDLTTNGATNVGLAHAALEATELRTKLEAATERVRIMTYLLQDDEDAGIFG